jgi:hypothetical protein
MIKDRVKDTTTTTGTGNITLAGSAPTGFQTFNSAFSTNVEFMYAIAGGAEWELGIGILSASTTLVRALVLSSSNAGSLVNFSAGTKDVFGPMPASRTPEAIKEATTYYVCPAGQTGAVYNGAGSVAVTPSDNNDGLATTRPLATIAAAVAKIAGKILLAPVTIQLADTDGGAADKVYFPSDVVVENLCAGGISAGSLGVGTSDLTDTLWPTGYVHIKGNETTPGNVDLIGAATFGGTASSVTNAFRVKNTNFRISGVDLRYFKFGVVGNQSLVMADKITGTSDNPSPTVIDASFLYVDDHSILRVGPATTVTNWVAWTVNGQSVFDCRTPNGFTNLTYSSTGGERAILINEGSKGYWQGTTASFTGAGAYVCFEALAGSTWNFNTDETTTITFNAANATAFRAMWGSGFGAWTDAGNMSITVTAIGKRAYAADHSYIYVGNMAAGSSADTMINGSMLGYSSSNWVADGDVKYEDFQISSTVVQPLTITRTTAGQNQLWMKAAGNNAWESVVWNCERARGTVGSPSAVADGDDVAALNGAVWTTGTTWETCANITIEAAGTSSSGSSPGRILMYTVPSGSTSIVRRLSVEPTGDIVPGTAALATGATSGFIYAQTCAGTPSGTPTTYTGRSAFVYDTTNNILYVYNGGWQAIGTPATQAEQETGTSLLKTVTPGRQHFHPSAAKCWLKATGDGTTVSASYNITSLTDTGAGLLTVNIGTDFSSANWAAICTIERASTALSVTNVTQTEVRNAGQAAGTLLIECWDDVATNHNQEDPASYFMIGFGDHA